MRWLYSMTLMIGLVLGCSTLTSDQPPPNPPPPEVLPPEESTLPPPLEVKSEKDLRSADYFLLKMLEEKPPSNVVWWVEYKRAQLWEIENPEVACEKFQFLAKEEKFPLRQVAELHSHRICPVGDPPTAPLDIEALPDWLKPQALEAELALAEKTQNDQRIMELLHERSKRAGPQSERVAMIKRALTIAKRLEDEAFEKRLVERLYRIAPRLRPNPGRSYWFRVAGDFRRSRDFKSARKYYRRILSNKRFSHSQKLSAWRGLALSHKNSRNKKAYLEALGKAWRLAESKAKRTLKRPGKTNLKLYHDASTTFARALWTAGHGTDARKILKRAERNLRGRYGLAEIYWLFGRMEEEKGNWSLAIEWLNKAEAQKSPNLDLREKIVWYLGWNHRKANALKDALAAFERGFADSNNEFAKARFLYWQGQTKLASGDTDDANRIFNDLKTFDPLGYYGLLAHRQTQTPIALPGTRELATDETGIQVAELVDVPVLEWLIALEETDLATEMLQQGALILRKRDTKDDQEETWVALFRYFARSGSYLKLYESLGRLNPERRNSILNTHPELLFPQPFREDVLAAAEQFSIPSELVYAIIRQESAFNPRARSPADAFGLMQLLPEVARKIAPRLNVSMDHPEDLFQPSINIPLGVHHLKQLWDQFKGQFVLAVASYNADGRAIKNWLKTRYRGDTVEFIEEIPYEETRAYVRLVMRNMIFYQVLNSHPNPVPFPEWLFTPLTYP